MILREFKSNFLFFYFKQKAEYIEASESIKIRPEEILMQRIQSLEEELLQEKLKSKKMSLQSAEAQKRLILLKKYLGIDQISAARGKKSIKWSNATLKKAIMIKSKGGQQLLDYVRANVVPLPCNTTIKKRLSKLKVCPGMLDINLKTLKADLEGLVEHQK